jgi:hypothetical protein
MKVSKQLEDALNEVSREVDAWPPWKRSLDPQNRRSGVGKFKKNYLLAGWTEGSVNHYLTYYQQDAATDTEPQVDDSKGNSILWFIRKLDGVIDTLDQVLTEDKWQKDENFPQLQQTGAKLRTLLEKL